MRKTCPWWARWWHRRLRRLDLEIMLPAVVRAADKFGGIFADELRRRSAFVAWYAFLREPGQEHWRCPCAWPDRQKARIRILFSQPQPEASPWTT